MVRKTITDIYNENMPRGVELFASGTITAATHTASGIIDITPSDSGYSYLLHSVTWVTDHAFNTDSYLSMTTSGKSTNPVAQDWVHTMADWKDLVAASDIGSIKHWDDQTAEDDIIGQIRFRPMVSLTPSAGESFKVTADGTFSHAVKLLVRYYLINTADI